MILYVYRFAFINMFLRLFFFFFSGCFFFFFFFSNEHPDRREHYYASFVMILPIASLKFNWD